MEGDITLLQEAVYFLLDRGAAIELVGDAEAPEFEVEGEAVTVSQVILKAYAAGMAEQR
ncbi:hypothetical protein [Methylobacterium goesingense]|nr:hypothetical protein CFIICLFH_0750 [Methylobacterium goesingense]